MECECLLQNNWWSLGSPSDWVAGCCGARLRVVLGRWVPDRQFFCTHFSIRKSRFSNSSSQVSFGYTIRSQYPPHRGPRSGIKWHRVLRSASRCRTLGFSAKRLQAGTKLLFAFLLKSENMWQTSPHPLTSLPKLGFRSSCASMFLGTLRPKRWLVMSFWIRAVTRRSDDRYSNRPGHIWPK